MSTIKLVVFGRLSTNEIINSEGSEPSQKQEAAKVFQQIKELKLLPLERQKINRKENCWYCTIDEQDFGYLVLTSKGYPERHVYSLITELSTFLAQNVSDSSTVTNEQIKKTSRKKLQDLVKQYEDLKKIDKIAEAQQSVDEVRVVMEQNVQKVLDRGDKLEDLEKKAYDMKSVAKDFSKNAEELKKIMYWRNMKLKIIIIVIVVAILCYILIPIIKHFV